MKRNPKVTRAIAVCGISIATALFFPKGSHATSVAFSDNNKYWGDNTTWAASQKWNTDVANGQWDGNRIDVIGDPDIKGGTADFAPSGMLSRVTFNYTSPYQDWQMLAPGNLFINVLNGTNDTVWDYVVTTMGTPRNGNTAGSNPTLAAGLYSIYDISARQIDAKRGTNDSAYILSGADNTGEWTGYYLRNNHPIGVQATILAGLSPVGNAYFSGFPGATVNNDNWARTSYYSFSDLTGGGLDLSGKDIIIAWEMTCANDVVYEKVSNPAPVPEPATLLLFGTGLLGLARGAHWRMKGSY